MTADEAIARAKAEFEPTWSDGQGWNAFTGEVRVVDMADAVARGQARTGNPTPAEQRERASR